MLKKRGFTLIELLVVIAIIGLLASIVMVSLSGAKSKSRDAKRQADIKSIQLALALYYSDNGMYPRNMYCPSSGGSGACSGSAPNTGLAPTYLPTMPADPSGTCTGTGASAGTGSGCYRYIAYGNGTGSNCNATTNVPYTYHLGAVLENSGTNILTQDLDAATSYYGSSPACTTGFTGIGIFDGNAIDCDADSASSPDVCYDISP